jgi:hypothetical protein
LIERWSENGTSFAKLIEPVAKDTYWADQAFQLFRGGPSGQDAYDKMMATPAVRREALFRNMTLEFNLDRQLAEERQRETERQLERRREAEKWRRQASEEAAKQREAAEVQCRVGRPCVVKRLVDEQPLMHAIRWACLCMKK